MIMKHRLLTIVAFAAVLFSCVKPEPAPELKAPEATYFINGLEAQDVTEIAVDSTLLFKAEITNTEIFECNWTLEEELMAKTQSFAYKFTDPGTYNVAFAASNEKGSCEKTFVVNVAGAPLEVEYSTVEETLETVIGTAVKVSVKVLSGDKETVHSWKVDGEEISTTTDFSWTPQTPGSYTLNYFGINRDKNTASRQWTIVAADHPLEGTTTPILDELSVIEQNSITFKANITSGTFGLTHQWSVDGTVQTSETTSEFTYLFTTVGTVTVGYKATNDAGDELTRTWTVTVKEKAPEPDPEEGVLIFDNFESANLGVSSFFKGNNVGGVNVMEIVENPYITAANSSSKVLLDHASLITWASSGYFTFKINARQDGSTISGETRAQYTKVRLKVYVGTTGFTPLLQEDAKGSKSLPVSINGVAFDPANPTLDAWNAAIKTNDWNVFVYDLTSSKYSTEVNNLSKTDQLQFRVCVDFNNGNKPCADVYFDDIEFIQ